MRGESRHGNKDVCYSMGRGSLCALPVIILCAGLGLQGCVIPAPALSDLGETRIDRWAEIKADDKTVGEILAAFNRAEQALHARDLDALMALYAQAYNYHGLRKDDLRKIWENLFAQYPRISSTHIFSRIVAVPGKPSTAEITCTGSLWAMSRQTGDRVNVDSWYGEVHHLTYEDGAWRIRGHAGEPPAALRFGVTPHPFF